MTELDPRDWCKAILEEVLFRGARDMAVGQGAVTVALEFHVSPNAAEHCLEIRVAGAVEPVILTKIPLQPPSGGAIQPS